MKIVVISGPSGVGKNTVVAEVLKLIPALRLGSSLTTRAARPNDVPGKYTYVSRSEFEERARRGELLEWAEYNGYLYGTLRPSEDRPALLEIEIQGAAQIKRLYPNACLMFMVTPGRDVQEQLQVLAERLRKRGTDQPAAIQKRLVRAEEELRQGQSQSDIVIVNDNLATVVRQTTASIQEYLATN
jgi:guanylate kinase